MENLGTLSKHQRKLISKQLECKRLDSLKYSNNKYESDKVDFEKDLNRLSYSYYNFKLSHNGIISYKGFENCNRTMRASSLNNLLHYNVNDNTLDSGGLPFDSCLGSCNSSEFKFRSLSIKQSKEIKKYCSKLCYYSKERVFKSSKSGKYKFKVSFLTLTAPVLTSNEQFLKAFDLFLDYLRRTANCTYVWKKEIGKKSGLLHVHILLNNFIPYYIVSWKWKRLLLSQGVIWPKNEKGMDTESHYRIELPKNSKQVGAYVAKYMAKFDNLIENVGYLWGKSKVLVDCKETVMMEGEVDNDELYKVYSSNRTVGNEWVKICLLNWNSIKKLAPLLFKVFEKQFFEFQDKISLEQRFVSV